MQMRHLRPGSFSTEPSMRITFLLGTKPDGSLNDSGMLALDCPALAMDGNPGCAQHNGVCPQFWRTHLAVEGGFDFNGDRDGLWVEGTAQASLHIGSPAIRSAARSC